MAGLADVEDGATGRRSRDAGEIDSVGRGREPDAPVRTVRSGAGPRPVGAAVIQLEDVALLEGGDGEVAALVERSGSAEAEHRTARSSARHFLPFERGELRGRSRAAREKRERRRQQRKTNGSHFLSAWRSSVTRAAAWSSGWIHGDRAVE